MAYQVVRSYFWNGHWYVVVNSNGAIVPLKFNSVPPTVPMINDKVLAQQAAEAAIVQAQADADTKAAAQAALLAQLSNQAIIDDALATDEGGNAIPPIGWVVRAYSALKNTALVFWSWMNR